MGPAGRQGGGFRLVVDALYGGVTDADKGVAVPFRFDSKIIEKALRNIRSRKIDTRRQIDPGLFSEVNRIMQQAAGTGYQDPDGETGFKRQIRSNTEVFAAFKAHRMGRDMASRLLDDNGQVKTFREFRKDTEDIVDHHVNAWLRTEYDTAVKRAHRAAEMRQFADEADVFPNIEWLPSTAVHRREAHIPFYHHIWPVNDPFWDAHKPGDEWGCQCGWKSTDEPVTDNRGLEDPDAAPVSPGLGGNPAKTGQLFSDDHPYFPSDCAHCGFYKPGIRDRLKHIFTARTKDCYNCQFILECMKEAGSKSHSYSLNERKRIYAMPIEDQFTPVFKKGKAMVLKHLIKTIGGDYDRVLDVAKAYALNLDGPVYILPEINAHEKALRQSLGLSTDNGKTPDIMLKIGSFVDTKSPESTDTISTNACKAFKQGGIACITDHATVLFKQDIEQYAQWVLNSQGYHFNEVSFLIKGRLYKKAKE